MSTQAIVPGFSPAQHGFKFPNSFAWSDLVKHPLLNKPIIDKTGNPNYGLCGGMAHTAHEIWLDKKPMFSTTKIPTKKDNLYYYIVEGLLESFGNKNQYLNKALEWHKLSSTEQMKRTGAELLALKILLTRGKLVQLYLMYQAGNVGSPWENHQVLAYGFEQDVNGDGKILCYDPNNPGKTTELTYTADKLTVTKLEQPGLNPKYKLHGFFVAQVRMDDLDTKLTYLATVGWTKFIQTAINQLQLSVDSIVKIMKEWYDLTPREILTELKTAGVNALKAGFSIMAVFKSGIDAVITLLKLVGYGLGMVIEFVSQALRSSLNRIGSALIKAGYKLLEIATEMVKTLKRSGEAVLGWLKTAYKLISEVGQFLKNILKLTVFQAAKLLKKLRFKIDDFVAILVKDFKCSALELAKNIQREYNKSALDILKILRKHFNLDWVKFAKMLFFDLKFSFDAVFSAIKNQFAIGLLEFRKVLS